MRSISSKSPRETSSKSQRDSIARSVCGLGIAEMESGFQIGATQGKLFDQHWYGQRRFGVVLVHHQDICQSCAGELANPAHLSLTSK